MKKLSLIALAIVITLVFLSTTVIADSSDISQSTSTTPSNSGYSTMELAVTICLMFAFISVIGVMFVKTVMKNNNNRLK